MARGLSTLSTPDPPRDQPRICGKYHLNSLSPHRLAQYFALTAHLQHRHCTVRASQIPIAPADRRPLLPRFPSLAAFEPRPTRRRACCELSERAGVRNPSSRLMQRSEKRALFDQLVGAGEERRRQREPERIRGLEVDDQFNFCGLLDR
jgi:hypothetical protein